MIGLACHDLESERHTGGRSAFLCRALDACVNCEEINFGVAIMATLATSVRTVAGSGLLASTCDSRSKCSASSPNEKLVLSVSHSKNIQRQQLGLGEKYRFFEIVPGFNRQTARLSSICRRAGAPGDDDKETERDSGANEAKSTVEEIEKALGDAFGGTLWFAVLLTCLAIFGGGYVYLVYNYADFTDIPILNGPKGV